MKNNIGHDQLYDSYQDQLERDWNFYSASFTSKVLQRPLSASKIALARIKHRWTQRPTLTTAKLFFGENMTVKLPEVVSEALVMFHFHEYGLSNALLSQLHTGMIFVDIGAHFGYFTLLASKLVSKDGFVHSFEPSKCNYTLLSKNTVSKINVKINNTAIWSTNTDLEFNEYDEKYSAFNSFTEPRLNYKGAVRKIKVPAISLDYYFSKSLPDFIKIDAESAEFEILKGMTNTINKCHPKISLEVGDYVKEVPSSKACIDYLLDRNYEVFEVKDRKIKPHVVRVSYEYDNLIFMKSEK